MGCCLDNQDGSPAGGGSTIPDGTADLDMLLWDLAGAVWQINARGAVNHFGVEVVLAAAGAESESIRAARATRTPTIAAGCGGCNNFQSESVASHGIQGANTEWASILGGLNNLIEDNCDKGVICGGENNDLQTTSGGSIIGSGNSNRIQANFRSFIGAGQSNDIRKTIGTASDNVIVGGNGSTIDDASYAFIGAGLTNRIGVNANCDYGVICGGDLNDIHRGTHVFIGGGDSHAVGGTTASNWSSIIGGRSNSIDGADYCTAGGRECDITHDGVTMFADSSTGTNKSSLEADTFHTATTNGRVMENPTMTAGRQLVEKNDEGTANGDGATLDFTVGTLSTNGDVLNVDFELQATRTDGTAGADAVAADGHLRARRQGGAVTIFGNTINTDTAGTPGTVSLVVSGDNLIVRFTTAVGGGANAWNVSIDWRARKVTI